MTVPPAGGVEILEASELSNLNVLQTRKTHVMFFVLESRIQALLVCVGLSSRLYRHTFTMWCEHVQPTPAARRIVVFRTRSRNVRK